MDGETRAGRGAGGSRDKRRDNGQHRGNQREGKKASDRYLEEGSRTIRVEPSRRDIC